MRRHAIRSSQSCSRSHLSIAGILWTTASPAIAFVFLTAAMAVGVAVLALGAGPAGKGSER